MASDWRAKLPTIFLVVLFAFSILPWSLLGAFQESSTLTFAVLDVGQGDALWIETPDHYQVLIDGGPGGAVLEKLGSRMPFWDREIDLLILTHPHADHLSGFLEILRRYRVRAVIEPSAQYETAEYAEWNQLLEKYDVPRYSAVSGIYVPLGKYAELSILSPAAPASGKRFSNVHDANIVSELRVGDILFLLMGDAEARLERELVGRELISDVSVLKVGHHGSKTSTSEFFLSAAKPEFAVISAGRGNRYGHPAAEVVERLKNAGIQLFRTDEMGDIVFETDGKKISVK